MRAESLRGVVALETCVLDARSLEGLVLRYGRFYGPGTGVANPASDGSVHVHVDAAAQAALLATTRGAPGVYNVAEPSRYASSEKAERALGWSCGFRR
jgi:nucleoside-diphosphate-sugar epimerase